MINRLLLLFTLVLLSTGALRAQNQESLASATFKQRLRGQYLHNDTAQAIINLYSRRQAGGASWIVGAALAATRLSIGSTTPTPPNSYVVNDNRVNPALAFLVASPIAAYGVGKLLHYSNGHLEIILTNYAAGQPLSRSVRRKLAPRFFAQPIIQYQPVKVQPVK